MSNDETIVTPSANSTYTLPSADDCKPPKVYPSTPMNTKPPVISGNTHTITRKTRTRQQTITVESQVSKEVNAAFDEIQNMTDLSNPIEELRRRMQRLFCEKNKEYASKLSDIERNRDEELALAKIRLAAATKTICTTKKFLQIYKPAAQPSQNEAPSTAATTGPAGVLSPMNSGGGRVCSAVADRIITPDMFMDMVKERNLLRDELRELENSYSDLFKRYEKMRENCVLLKNAEESLKKNMEDEAAKYDKLAAIYAELRQTAAIELNKANEEVVRLQNQHDENTLSLRCRLKRSETEINSLQLTIQGKNAEIEQLKELNDELMRKASMLDDEDGLSMSGSYDEYHSIVQ